jgi:hypothetical protein
LQKIVYSILLAGDTYHFTLFQNTRISIVEALFVILCFQVFKTEIILWGVKPDDVVSGEKIFVETRRFLFQVCNEKSVILYLKAARNLLCNLIMMMFYAMKGHL